GQYVQHALVETEEKPNLALAVTAFNTNNPDWSKIQVVMTDKALHEKEVLHEAWPQARQLLCRWHVETWLKKQCSRLGDVGRVETKQLKVIMKGLVNSVSQQQYDDYLVALLETVGNDKENHLYMSFMQHWDPNTDEWVMFKRGGVPHLMNNTNNRLSRRCFVFDPMKLQSNVSSLTIAVRTVVEPMLDMTDQLQFESITGCVQQDSSS
ncbi:hypothetical protein PHMEG_00019206, partial [Phytophthora megakarya]